MATRVGTTGIMDSPRKVSNMAKQSAKLVNFTLTSDQEKALEDLLWQLNLEQKEKGQGLLRQSDLLRMALAEFYSNRLKQELPPNPIMGRPRKDES
jgi:hypothetical protein